MTSVVCLMLAFTLSCGAPREEYAGNYEASGNGSTVFLELKEDGHAIQRVGDDEVNFKWKVKDKEIRFHTKSGGIIVGKVEKGTIELRIPGKKMMVFKKVD